jgi:stearoyl-CoA desaturase (delta-9 desaturase)
MNFLSTGILDLSGWGIVIATLVFTHITIAAVTIFLHRQQSHHSLTLHPVISHFFRFWLWLTTGMITREWVAIHRKHHARCETADDPHSPQVVGLKKVLLEGSELYRHEALNQETLEKYGQGTPDDWLERNLYGRNRYAGIMTMLICDVLLFGVIGITVFAVQMLWSPVWAAGVINGIGHYYGYRNFESSDASRNISPWGILIGGEELHNNHHAYPASARLSNQWWEFDIGWFYIKTLSILGLASVISCSPKIDSLPGKRLIDMDTVRALTHNRFHIIKQYGRMVIRPVIQLEYQSAKSDCRNLFLRVRKLMTREDIRLTDVAKAEIAEALRLSRQLETVYTLKQKLKDLWDNSRQHQSRRIERLQAWCTEAEQSNILALQEFALYLRGYTEIKIA